MYQLFRITGCEASLDSFCRIGLLEHCSPLEKHALYLYQALKLLCRRDGHTYIKRSWLEHEARNVHSKYQASPRAGASQQAAVDWGEVQDFLEGWQVIVRENNGRHVYLYKYWNAEMKIAEGFRTLRKRHKVDPWTFDIDVEK